LHQHQHNEVADLMRETLLSKRKKDYLIDNIVHDQGDDYSLINLSLRDAPLFDKVLYKSILQPFFSSPS
jgi:hypothetical protein